MTCIDSRPARARDEVDPTERVPDKTTLFCPVCEYEGAAAEDWCIIVRDGTRAFVCPVCDTTVAHR